VRKGNRVQADLSQQRTGGPLRLSAVIIAKDEEDRIEPCLRALAGCVDEVVTRALLDEIERELANKPSETTFRIPREYVALWAAQQHGRGRRVNLFQCSAHAVWCFFDVSVGQSVG